MLKGSESKTKGPSKWQTYVSQKKKKKNDKLLLWLVRGSTQWFLFFCDSWGDPHNDFSLPFSGRIERSPTNLTKEGDYVCG